MSLQFSSKSPTDVDWFRFDWTAFLAAVQQPNNAPPDTLTGTPTVTVIGSPSDLVISNVILVNAFVYFQAAMGSNGQVYLVANTITTAYGRNETRTAYLPVNYPI